MNYLGNRSSLAGINKRNYWEAFKRPIISAACALVVLELGVYALGATGTLPFPSSYPSEANYKRVFDGCLAEISHLDASVCPPTRMTICEDTYVKAPMSFFSTCLPEIVSDPVGGEEEVNIMPYAKDICQSQCALEAKEAFSFAVDQREKCLLSVTNGGVLFDVCYQIDPVALRKNQYTTCNEEKFNACKTAAFEQMDSDVGFICLQQKAKEYYRNCVRTDLAGESGLYEKHNVDRLILLFLALMAAILVIIPIHGCIRDKLKDKFFWADWKRRKGSPPEKGTILWDAKHESYGVLVAPYPDQPVLRKTQALGESLEIYSNWDNLSLVSLEDLNKIKDDNPALLALAHDYLDRDKSK